MKILIGILTVTIGAVTYFATFSAFGESWFPYYYHDYISYWFFAGLVVLLLLPPMVALFKKVFGPQYLSTSYFSRYYKTALGINFVVVLACIVTFAYMLSNGVILNGGKGVTTHTIVPAQ